MTTTQSTYTIRYNRSSNHIDGIAARTKSTGEERGGVVAYYAESACPALTRGSFATGASFEDVAEALEAAKLNARIGGRKMCKKCEAAAQALIDSE